MEQCPVEPAGMADNVACILNRFVHTRCFADGQGHMLSLEQVVVVWSFDDEHLIPCYIKNAMDVLNREKRVESIVHVNNIMTAEKNKIFSPQPLSNDLLHQIVYGKHVHKPFLNH